MCQSNNKIQRFVLIAFLAFAIVSLSISCGGGNSTRAKQVQETYVSAEELIDQPYGSHDRQKFDIYLPAGRSAASTPVLFLIHGGGWAAGDKSGYRSEINRLQNIFPQMAFVSVGYRLADGKAMTNQFPTQEEDVKACIEYVINNRSQYGISGRFATYGGSAGAHLAMLYAYKYGHGLYKPAAVISLVGPTNLSTVFEQIKMTGDPKKEVYYGWFVDGVGGTPEEKPELCFTSSPINYVTPDSPPTLMLYGADDTVVPPQQAEDLVAKLTSCGVEHTYRLYPGQWHDMKGVVSEIFQELVDFLNTYLK